MPLLSVILAYNLIGSDISSESESQGPTPSIDSEPISIQPNGDLVYIIAENSTSHVSSYMNTVWT
ncbi:MAG: hypothetical protein ACJZ4Z_04230 [Candidatus Thalassarchaeaceae archaeon]